MHQNPGTYAAYSAPVQQPPPLHHYTGAYPQYHATYQHHAPHSGNAMPQQWPNQAVGVQDGNNGMSMMSQNLNQSGWTPEPDYNQMR